MIQTKELRIGNNIEFDGEIITVTGISKNKITYSPSKVLKYEINAKHFDPIRLTEEILLKLGFHKVDIEEDITYRLEPNEDVCIVYENDFSVGLFPNEKSYDADLGVLPRYKQTLYLHQLQNLYFILTGEELIFKNTHKK